MAWFQRKTAGIRTPQDDRKDVPEGYWRKCPITGEVITLRTLEENLMVTPAGHHFRFGALEYCRAIFEDEPFERHDADLVSADPLAFEDRKPYKARLAAAWEQTGLNDAVVAATGSVGGHPLSLAVMDFSFIGGSMGAVVGEIVARAIRRATAERRALMIVSQTGGARMMEGALSLMQMAKTAADLAVHAEAGLPYISFMTHPTTGGVTASFAMLGDYNLAEPGALIGFAGPRVIRETIGQDLPKGFQSAEFLLERGFLDAIVPRTELRQTVIHLLDLLFENDPMEAVFAAAEEQDRETV